jgi:hypothetical protein
MILRYRFWFIGLELFGASCAMATEQSAEMAPINILDVFSWFGVCHIC